MKVMIEKDQKDLLNIKIYFLNLFFQKDDLFFFDVISELKK